ncbi:MAG: FAD:protein FMN transferase [Candidatus Doudnabacteria bacterium]|nr:FAD:protein FMN transferase [Candidatus Doudnabacteria bacterium]
MSLKSVRLIMGMPVELQVLDAVATQRDLEDVFEYFLAVDSRFSTYKLNSEISKINRGEILPADYSLEVQQIFSLSERTKTETEGYFNIQTPDKKFDPSGIVKGWAVYNASLMLEKKGFRNFYIEAGGDIQTAYEGNRFWRVGVKNPFGGKEFVKVLNLQNHGVATSGNYIRGAHIYNPHNVKDDLGGLASVTVVAENVYEADRFATALFAMGEYGIEFARKKALAAFFITSEKKTIFTEKFTNYV